jgi:DNA modification methylase
MLYARPTIILKNFTTLKPDSRWSFSELGRAETTMMSHSYHRYPAKFIPQLVDKLISQHTKEGDTVCDPFGGCGTTLVQSKISGRKSIGFDINPVAKLITDTKTRAIDPNKLIKTREVFIKKYDQLKKKRRNIYHNERVYYWFDKQIVQKLDVIYKSILIIKDTETRMFFLCAFSHVLKNCSRWLMKSIKPTIDKNKKIQDPKKSFLRHLDSMIKKNEIFYTSLKKSGRLEIPAKMRLWNSTKKLPLKDRSIDLIVTSPPYVTSYEYGDLHQLSLLWFGDDKKHFKNWDKIVDEFFNFKKLFIGTSHKKVVHKNFKSKIAENIVTNLEKQNRSLSQSVANYFNDMQLVFSEIYRILKKEKKACIIIGNTELLGVTILNAQVATEQMINLGFKKVEFIKREVLNKMITPWRDNKTGKFTDHNNPSKKRIYEYEYVLLMKK